eukprot:231248_1
MPPLTSKNNHDPPSHPFPMLTMLQTMIFGFDSLCYYIGRRLVVCSQWTITAITHPNCILSLHRYCFLVLLVCPSGVLCGFSQLQGPCDSIYGCHAATGDMKGTYNYKTNNGNPTSLPNASCKSGVVVHIISIVASIYTHTHRTWTMFCFLVLLLCPCCVLCDPCDYIYGGDWFLVRHAYNGWHTATDSLQGTNAYGTYNGDPSSTTTWSVEFSGALSLDGSSTFMFSNGDCSQWLVAEHNQFKDDQHGDYEAHVVASHYAVHYDVMWNYNQNFETATPLISWNGTRHQASILYAEASTVHYLDRFDNISGSDLSVNVWIKNPNTYFAVGTGNLEQGTKKCKAQGTLPGSVHSLQNFHFARLTCMKTGSSCRIGLVDNPNNYFKWIDGTWSGWGFSCETCHGASWGTLPWGSNRNTRTKNSVMMTKGQDFRWQSEFESWQGYRMLCNGTKDPIYECLAGGHEINGWYDGTSIDLSHNLWHDKSNSNNNGIIYNSTGIGVFAGTDALSDLYATSGKNVVYGTSDTQIAFHLNLRTNHTIFSLCKYRVFEGAKR